MVCSLSVGDRYWPSLIFEIYVATVHTTLELASGINFYENRRSRSFMFFSNFFNNPDFAMICNFTHVTFRRCEEA